MAFSPQFLDELRSRVSLAGVVGPHVRLIRRGREFVGLCPFHKEKTPSFNVVEDKGFYHCFGCGAHGDAIGFSMRISNLPFREAVETLAKQAGLKVPDDTPAQREREAHVATMHDACESACRFFERQLRGIYGVRALEYLRRRGVTDAQMEEFRLGYSPSGATTLVQELSASFPIQLLIEAGVVRKDDSGRAFDFFRDRVIFPIMDRQGRVIAFGGRLMSDGQPKYLNSPDSGIFHKGTNLFAFHLARKRVKDDSPPIVAEGYMDVIALHRAGFGTSVAPLGTALTEHQIAELWKLSSEPILCFDGDIAGRRAAGRALERALPLLQPGLSLRFVTLPPGEDPDSLIQTRGPSAFGEHLKTSTQISEYLWETATQGRHFETPENLLRLQESLSKKILLIEHRQVQRLYQRFIGDKIWDLRVQNRKRDRKKRDARDYPEELTQWLGPEATTRKILMTMLALVINHPQFIQREIDQFVTVHPTARDLRDLHEKIMEVMAADPDASSETLKQRLSDAGFGNSVNKLFSSDVYRSRRFAHPKAEPDDVAVGWRSLFSRYLLPSVKRQLEEAQSRLEREMTDENWNTFLMYRDLFDEQNTEAELVRERWESAERTGTWRPNTAAA